MIFPSSVRPERNVFASREQFALRSAKAKGSSDHVQFKPSILPLVQEFVCRRLSRFQILKKGYALREIDGTTVVRIDESKIPKFRALVKVGNTGERDLD